MTDKQGAAPAAHQHSTIAPNNDRAIRIRLLNDRFRQSLRGGRVFLTAGVHAFGPARVAALLAKVTNFHAFDDGNDPYHEHDFGAIDDGGGRFFFKIDYYDQKLEMGSPDPADPEKTCRVLTLMLASEY